MISTLSFLLGLTIRNFGYICSPSLKLRQLMFPFLLAKSFFSFCF